MSREYKHEIITHSMDECDEMITKINRDPKTNYVEDSFLIDGVQVTHIVETDHNKLNFKRKYNRK